MQYNAQVAERDAMAARRKAEFDQYLHIRKAEQRMGTLRAKLGASGAVVSDNAPLILQASQAFESELQNALIGHEGLTEEQRFMSEAAGHRVGAQYAMARGRSAYRSGLLDAGSNILGGIFGMKQAGIFG
jgi:hypothetical protein